MAHATLFTGCHFLTGIHAAVLAPLSTRVVRYPEDLLVEAWGVEQRGASSTVNASAGAEAHSERDIVAGSGNQSDTSNGDDGNSSSSDPHSIISYDPATTVVLFPSETSVTMAELPVHELLQLTKVVVVDATWQKTGGVLQHPKLKHLRHVKLSEPPQESRFWRYHNRGNGCVSTIEALVLVLSEFRKAVDTPELLRSQGGGGGGGEPLLPRFAETGQEAAAAAVPSEEMSSSFAKAHGVHGMEPAVVQSSSGDGDGDSGGGSGGGDGDGGEDGSESLNEFRIRPKDRLDEQHQKQQHHHHPELRLLLLFGLVADAIKLDYNGQGRDGMKKTLGVRCEGGRAAGAAHKALLPMDEAAKELRRNHRRQKGSERQVRQKESSAGIRAANMAAKRRPPPSSPPPHEQQPQKPQPQPQVPP